MPYCPSPHNRRICAKCPLSWLATHVPRSSTELTEPSNVPCRTQSCGVKLRTSAKESARISRMVVSNSSAEYISYPLPSCNFQGGLVRGMAGTHSAANIACTRSIKARSVSNIWAMISLTHHSSGVGLLFSTASSTPAIASAT